MSFVKYLTEICSLEDSKESFPTPPIFPHCPMRKALFPVAFWCLTALPILTQAQTKSDEAARAYIDRFKDLAISEQKRTGMPAAIKLAQGLHETGAGSSLLATKANNHFGMKCKRTWTGETFAYTDDAPDECFRKYPTAEESYRDQGNYLRSNPRYATCFATDVKDYKTWAAELRRAGYATNPKYAERLTKTIEDYGLQQYTLIAAGEGSTVVATPTNPPVSVAEAVRQDVQNIGKELGKIPEKAKDLFGEAAKIPEKARELAANTFQKGSDPTIETYKGLQGFYATAGQSLLEEASKYNVRYAKLLEWNDLPDAPLPYDMFVFLEKKPSRGSSATHVVKSGETLHKIAQLEAIQLASLRQLNMIDIGEEPQTGVVLQLQRGATARPAVYLASEVKSPAVVVGVVQDDSWIPKKETSQAEKLEVTPPPVPETPVVVNVPPAPAVVVPEKSATTAPVPEAVPAVPEKPVVVAAIVVPEKAMTPPTSEVPVREGYPSGLISKSEITEASPAQVVEAATQPIKAIDEPMTPVVTEPTEKAVVVETPAEPEQPVYEDTPLGRLKAKMDKAVYAKKESEAPVEKTVPEAPQPKAPATAPATATGNRPSFHTVAKGETVFGIAKKYGVSVTELRKWNSMDFSAMKVGQKLKLKP